MSGPCKLPSHLTEHSSHLPHLLRGIAPANCFSLLSSHFPPLHWICSIMKICYYSSLLYKQQQKSSFLTLFPLSRYCQFPPALIFEAKLLQRSIFMVSSPFLSSSFNIIEPSNQVCVHMRLHLNVPCRWYQWPPTLGSTGPCSGAYDSMSLSLLHVTLNWLPTQCSLWFYFSFLAGP